MGGNMPVSGKYGRASIEFNSVYLASHLAGLGIVVNRGRFDLLRPHIPDNLAHHLIRGYLDGDGCISVNQQIVFEGQTDILQWIKDTLVAKAEASENVSLRKRTGIHEVAWGGRLQTPRIIKYLYQDATIWMDRKRKVAREW
jgi:hypothetical protein